MLHEAALCVAFEHRLIVVDRFGFCCQHYSLVTPRQGRLVEPPYEFIADGLKHGEVIPFFGAAASAVYRPPNEPWTPGKPFMPFGAELARTLAKAANYPVAHGAQNVVLSELARELDALPWQCDHDRQLVLSELSRVSETGDDGPQATGQNSILAPLLDNLSVPLDLALVASWAQHVQGHRRAVDRKLHESFAVECAPGLLHNKLAGVDATQLYVTTNYDDVLERALEHRKPHVIVDRGERGLQVTIAGTTPIQASSTGDDLYALLNDPNTQQPSHPILFKMHGSVDKSNPRNDSYLITEQDYVDFLGRADGRYVPPYVSALMQGRDFLFLGYSLDDWNVRVILRKLLTRSAAGGVKFWAIVRGHSHAQQQVWQVQNLNIYSMDLVVFAEKLARHL